MKKIFILFLMFSFLLYSFTKSEQSYIDKSKITKTSLPDDMINTTGDTSYIITSIAIAYYDFNKKMIDYEVDCLPVVAREDIGNKKRLKVVGRVSKTTVAKVFLECSIH